MNHSRFPVFFVSHGAGPWPYVDELRGAFARTAAGLAAIPRTLPEKPRAILAVSGHWEERAFTVASAPQPPMVYDYAGFPEHTYHIRYPAPGAPELAMRVRDLLEGSGIDTAEDPGRGFDHGVFVPLYLMYPQGDVPVAMLSIRADYDPLVHLQVGRALERLRDEGVLILGSGLTYHNLRRFGPPGAEASERFEAWLHDAVAEPDADIRAERLSHWEQAPEARQAHPREDHLVPLMVAAGAAGSSPGERFILDRVWEVTMASYRFADR